HSPAPRCSTPSFPTRRSSDLRERQVGLVKLTVDVELALRRHRPPVASGAVQTVVQATEPLPPSGDFKRFDDVDVLTPLGEILPGKHVPVAFEQRPALRFGQALQAAEVVRVVLEQVWVVLNPGRNESVPDSRLVLPNDVPQALVHEHFLDPKVAD